MDYIRRKQTIKRYRIERRKLENIKKDLPNNNNKKLSQTKLRMKNIL